MIVGLWVDLVEVARIRAVLSAHRDRFLRRILTGAERAYVGRYRDPAERLAGRWAAKEAALKALGTGLGEGVSWQDVEILPTGTGQPELHLHRKALVRARALGATVFHVTITHSQELALAQVILERA